MSASPGVGAGIGAEPTAATRRGDARQRITHAAMDLFEQHGYTATTLDTIAEHAGVARRTFFHHFSSKDEVVFPGHEALIERVRLLLSERPAALPVDAVGDALRLVLTNYLADPELALRRYQLTRSTPELREREIAWVQRYQLLFSRYLNEHYAGQPHGALAADAIAASLVSVHNHVLRGWLKRGGGGDALGELDDALQWFDRSLALMQRGDGPRRLVVAVFDDDIDPAVLAQTISDARAAER